MGALTLPAIAGEMGTHYFGELVFERVICKPQFGGHIAAKIAHNRITTGQNFQQHLLPLGPTQVQGNAFFATVQTLKKNAACARVAVD